MCYSAPVSFTLAGILTVVGVLAIVRAKRKDQLMFATTPLLFAVQQAAEGFVWLAYGCSDYENFICAKYLFLCFAFVIWPVWLPLSLWMIEKQRVRKMILKALYIVGAVYSIYTAIILLLYAVHVEVVGHSIRYTGIWYDGFWMKLQFSMYLLPTVVSFFISSFPRVWILGCAGVGSLIFTYMIMQATLVSVWCFFAAALSMMIVWILGGTKNGS